MAINMHAFKPSKIDPTVCSLCHAAAIEHADVQATGVEAARNQVKNLLEGKKVAPEIALGSYVFESGAKRSTIMPFYAAIPPASIRRVALRATGAPEGEVLMDDESGSEFSYEGGSRKYGYDNWRRGLPLEDTFNHLIDHLLKWKAAIDEGRVPVNDDLAAAAWAILMPLMTFERDYALQAAYRAGLHHRPAEEIDTEMRRAFTPYLLQPLAAERTRVLAPPPPAVEGDTD